MKSTMPNSPRAAIEPLSSESRLFTAAKAIAADATRPRLPPLVVKSFAPVRGHYILDAGKPRRAKRTDREVAENDAQSRVPNADTILGLVVCCFPCLATIGFAQGLRNKLVESLTFGAMQRSWAEMTARYRSELDGRLDVEDRDRALHSLEWITSKTRFRPAILAPTAADAGKHYSEYAMIKGVIADALLPFDLRPGRYYESKKAEIASPTATFFVNLIQGIVAIEKGKRSKGKLKTPNLRAAADMFGKMRK